MRTIDIHGMKHFEVDYYRAEVSRLQELAIDMESNEYKAQQKKVEAIQVTMLMQEGTRIFMEGEIIDELACFNDCAMTQDTPEVQYLLWLLETYGFEDDAQEIRGWDWL